MIGLLVIAASCGGCSRVSAEKQVRERIASMRDAIAGERVDAILEFSTPDWRFDAPDGTSYNRESYLARTAQLFADFQVESFDTQVDHFEQHDSRAEVRLTQTMVRTETDATGTRSRFKVHYAERQEWIETRDRGWLVARVSVLHRPVREKLSQP